MEDTWFNRDLPVLKAVVELSDENMFVDASEVDEKTGMDPGQVDKALRALRDGGYFTRSDGSMDRLIDTIYGVTGGARRTVGMWPQPQQLAEDLVAQLEKQAEQEPDPEKQSRIKAFLKGTGQAGRDVAVDVMASVLKQQMGI